MTLQAIAFDAYGTLLDTGTGSVDAARQILARNSSALDPESFYGEWKRLRRQLIASLEQFETEARIFRKGLRQLYEKYRLPGSAEEDVSLLLATLGKRTAYPDVIPCLDQLRDKYRIIIASNTDTQPLLEDLRRNHIFYDCLLTSESLQVYKPGPQFYRHILQLGPYLPSEVLYVGDSLLEDIDGPRAAGMQAVWLNRKGEQPLHLVPQVSDLQELCRYLTTDHGPWTTEPGNS